MTESRGITMATAKLILRQMVERKKKGEDTTILSIEDLIEEQDLWMADEWTHLGYCIIVCLENTKLVSSYKLGNTKLLDSLLGKVMKMSNTTTDPSLTRELMQLVIDRHF